jgi:hypothetical protein
MTQEYKFAYRHSSGCGEIAFISTRVFKAGDSVNINDIIFENLDHPTPGTDIICPHCNKKVYFNSPCLSIEEK